MIKCTVVGAGFAGAVVAQKLASEGFKVELIDKQKHLAGSAYDEIDQYGVLVHRYGPHMFFTNNDRVWDYISQFGEWYQYTCYNNVEIDDDMVPFPFNFNSIDILFGDKAKRIQDKLIKRYGYDSQVPILELMKETDQDIKQLADLLYKKDFLPYTKKHWGLTPEENGFNVTARVPVRMNRDNRLLLHKYQYLPKKGYNELFKEMLDHNNINIKLGVQALDNLCFSEDKTKLLWKGEETDRLIIYTGSLDELFAYQYGELPYRTLEFKQEVREYRYFDTCVVSYPADKYPYTRATEYRSMMFEKPHGKASTIVYEIPMAYSRKSERLPFYPFSIQEAVDKYMLYKEAAERVENLYCVGRLAQYKYMNMDQVIEQSLKMVDRILAKYK